MFLIGQHKFNHGEASPPHPNTKDMDTYHKLIPKRAIKAIEKFAADLQAFAQETGEQYPTLYEDANTTFEIRDLVFTYDGQLLWKDETGYQNWERYITEDEDGNEVWDCCYEWDEGLRYWRAALRRAKRYWSMDAETLDRIQDGEQEDTDDDN